MVQYYHYIAALLPAQNIPPYLKAFLWLYPSDVFMYCVHQVQMIFLVYHNNTDILKMCSELL